MQFSSSGGHTNTSKRGGMQVEQRQIGDMHSALHGRQPTIGEYIPHGHTRRLATTYEILTEAAMAEMNFERSHLRERSSRRNSIPPQAEVCCKFRQHGSEPPLAKGSRDDSFIVERYLNDEEYPTDQRVFHFDNIVINNNDKSNELTRCHNWSTFVESQSVGVAKSADFRSLDSRESFGQRAIETMRSPCGIGHNNNTHMSRMRVGKVYPYAMSGTKYAAKMFKGMNDAQRYEHHYYDTPVGRANEMCGSEDIQERGINGDSKHERVFTSCADFNALSSERYANDVKIRHSCVANGNERKHRSVGYDATAVVDSRTTRNVADMDGLATSAGKTTLCRRFPSEDNRSITVATPVRYSPATFSSPPPAGERVVVYERKETGNLLQSKRDAVTRDPVATSTPVDGSPPSMVHSIGDSPSRMLNRSGISTITASTIDPNFEQDYVAEIKRLNEGILIQEERLSQAIVALAHAKNFSSNYGTLAELCAHRELLLCRERHAVFHRELERIKMLHLIKKRMPQLSSKMQSTFEVLSIVVHLNRNFSIRCSGERDAYAFLALLKAADQVDATEAVTPIGGRTMRVNTVQFNGRILFTKMPLDFTVTVEIYALKMHETKRHDDRHCAVIKNKAKSLLNPNICVGKQSMNDESVVSSSEFTLCGRVLLNRDTVGTQRFYLENVEYPLEGTIELKSSCTPVPPIIETGFSGFLTMYEMVSDLASWVRYWAVLRRGVVRFWKYPDDEAAEKTAIAYMDLTKCTNVRVKPASFDVCFHPNAFCVDLLLSPRLCVVEKKRVLLSADTKEQCMAWIDAINETLALLRG